MKRLLEKTSFYKFMPVLFCLFLAACGSGGGGDEPIDLGGGGGTNPCGQSVSKSIDNNGGSVQSKDGKATVSVAPTNIPTGSVTFRITVQCSVQQSFNGFAYTVSFPDTNATPPAFSISIQFEGTAPAGVDLRLGIFTGDPNQLWQVVATGSVQNNVAQADGLNNAETYGVFVLSTGGGGSPPSAPTNVKAVPATGACRIDITWSSSTDPDRDLTSYNVFRDGNSLGTVRADTCFGTCSFPDVDNPTGNVRLLRGTSHTYSIQATDVREHIAESADSNRVTAPSSCPLF